MPAADQKMPVPVPAALARRGPVGRAGDRRHAEAHAALGRLHAELGRLNVSAAASLAEGLEETLTLHRLDLFRELGVSFKTTNMLESIMAQVEQRTAKVDHWRTSDQKQRWCAAALLVIEPRLREVKGHRRVSVLSQRCCPNFN